MNFAKDPPPTGWVDKPKGVFAGTMHLSRENAAQAKPLTHLRGSIFVPHGVTADLPNLTTIEGSIFAEGVLNAPALAKVGGTLWAGTTADVSAVPVATLEALGNANRLELAIIMVPLHY